MKTNALVIEVLMIALSAGCSGGKAAGGAAAPTTEAAPEVVWSEMTREQRLDWMGLEVFPKMKAAFAKYDGEGYVDFKCQTCHGDDMEAVDFAMPTPSLYALSPTQPVEEATDYDPEITQFMVEVVAPEMASLLHTTPYDPATGEGFGCFSCHPRAE